MSRCGRVAVRRIPIRTAELFKGKPIETVTKNELVDFTCGGTLLRDIIKIVGENKLEGYTNTYGGIIKFW
jgi:hypothetical protein